MDTEELKTADPLCCSPVDVDQGLFPPLLPEVNNQLLCFAEVEEEVVVMTPQCHFTYFLPIGCRIIVGYQAYNCGVISELDDGELVSYKATQSWVNRE